jgi:hypothetical protein
MIPKGTSYRRNTQSMGKQAGIGIVFCLGDGSLNKFLYIFFGF